MSDGESLLISSFRNIIQNTTRTIGVRAPLDLGGGDLAQKKYSMPESMSVEIVLQMHSNCVKNKNVHNDSSIESLDTQWPLSTV